MSPVIQLATDITSIARIGRVGEDPREEVGVGVGVVECELYRVPIFDGDAALCGARIPTLAAITS